MFGITDYSKPIVDFGNFDASQLGSAAGFGGAVVLIGMVTVFAVLCIIWLCLVLFKVFFHDIPARKASKAAEPAVSEPVVSAPVVNNDQDEIVAVIAAAIAMAESECSDTKFTVVSFKRK